MVIQSNMSSVEIVKDWEVTVDILKKQQYSSYRTDFRNID